MTFVGMIKSTITFSDPDFHAREMTLQGSRNATREDFEQVRAAVSAGYIDIRRYITHRCGFEDMIGQFCSWLKPESKVMKTVVELD